MDVCFGLREIIPARCKLFDINQIEVCQLFEVVKESDDVARYLVLEEPQKDDDLKYLNQAPDEF